MRNHTLWLIRLFEFKKKPLSISNSWQQWFIVSHLSDFMPVLELRLKKRRARKSKKCFIFFFELKTSQATFPPSLKKIEDHQQSNSSKLPRMLLFKIKNWYVRRLNLVQPSNVQVLPY
jgi:hypothetical protein